MSRRQSLLVLGAAAAVLLALLATFAIALANSQSKADNDVKQRFRERAQVSAALTRALFATVSSESGPQNAKLYGGAHVTAAALAKQLAQSGGQGGFLAVLDARGRVLATSPNAPSNLSALLGATGPELHAVLHGHPYALSNVIGAGTSAPTMQLLEPFATRYGPRVLVSGFAPPLIAAFIGGYLAQVPNAQGGHAYAIDAHGVIIASTDRHQAPGAIASEPGLLAALSHLREGSFGSDRYFDSVPVRGSTWRVVLTAPTSTLFASVNGSRKWVPWGLFIAFAFAAVVAIAMLRGVLNSTARVAVANRQLGGANEQLAVTNRVLEQRARELARSNAELEQFASIASHDLQEPLRKVQTFAEQLRVREHDQLSEHGRDYLERMSSAARRMQDLIDDLLRFSRVTTNTRPFVAVDLAATAREVRADLEGVIDETGATVELGELPTVQADPVQMRQLLQNLLSNALKFHRDGVAPHVKVTGRVDGRLAEIAVSDDGIGFDERYAQRIFRVFERLHGRGVYPGTGIGLALCRKIVERHGGTITATSAPDEGATFLVKLPLEHSDEELEWIAAADASGREAGFTAAAGNDRSGEQPYVAV
jgi:signal transduction histidine kinase